MHGFHFTIQLNGLGNLWSPILNMPHNVSENNYFDTETVLNTSNIAIRIDALIKRPTHGVFY